jgi:hypothetical protein
MRMEHCRLFLPRARAVSLLLAVDTATVRLTVHLDFLRNPNAFGPSFTEIPIEERYILGFSHFLSDLSNKIVFLITTVEESCREGIETFPLGDARRMGKPKGVTVQATFFFPKGNLSQKGFKRIDILPDDRKPLLTGIDLQRIETSSILQIGMDIGIVEAAEDFVAFPPEDPEWIDRTWGTADMQKNFQNSSFCVSATHWRLKCS